MSHIDLIQSISHSFARGGGGGSGGGSGGGGGGILLIGYIPAYYMTHWANKRINTAVAIVLGSLVGTLVTVGFLLLNIIIGIAVGIGAVCGVYFGVKDFHGRIYRLIKRSRTKLKFAARSDPAWSEASLRDRVREVFTDFQADWTNFDVDHMRTYTSERYYTHMSLLLAALKQMGRQNIVNNPHLLSYQVADIDDERNNDADAFDMYIRAGAHDKLVDTKTGNKIYSDSNPFEEIWHFDRQGDTWVLDGIEQATADAWQRSAPLQQFAEANGMFYSLDMGWLLLPRRGQLFSKASFKNSDVNNHVIGMWDDLIVQLYTYIPAKSNRTAQNYLIGQINLPKSYGGIIIKRRNVFSIFSKSPRGYQKISFEWPDFNKRFLVYATDADKVTSFELLNPAVMADLYDRNLKINIEVVDNVVYFYSLVARTQGRYAGMLDILKRAQSELRM